MWRKARGKPKKKPAKTTTNALTTPAAVAGSQRKLKQASESSDRTSKAETAFDALSDNEAVGREAEKATLQLKHTFASQIGRSAPSQIEDTIAPLPVSGNS